MMIDHSPMPSPAITLPFQYVTKTPACTASSCMAKARTLSPANEQSSSSLRNDDQVLLTRNSCAEPAGANEVILNFWYTLAGWLPGVGRVPTEKMALMFQKLIMYGTDVGSCRKDSSYTSTSSCGS
jgi:hypothetical protein